MAPGLAVSARQGKIVDRTWIGPLVASALLVVGTAVWWSTQSGEGKPKSGGKAIAEIDRPTVPPIPDEKLLHRSDIASDRAKAPPGAPNVVVVIVNAWRRDQLSAYGGPPSATPFLASFAEQGTRFDDVVAAAPWARPSDAALMTGREPSRIGMSDTGDGADRRVLSNSVVTLAEYLTGKGWWSVGVTANFNLNARYGFAQGFDVYRDAQLASFAPASRLNSADQVAIALQFLDSPPEGSAGRPVFLMLSIADAHKPFQIPLTEYEPFAGPEHEVAPYRAAIKRADDAMGALDVGLRARGLTEKNTVWVLVGDHGEGLSMPEAHGKQHGRLLYDSAVRVPWLMRGPGVGVGQVVQGLSAHVDLYPTLLGVVGDWASPADVDGNDWSDLVANGGKTTRLEAFTETWYLEANRAAVWTSAEACQKNWGPRPDDGFRTGCFDRSKDADFRRPRENVPLMGRLEVWRSEVLAEAATFRETVAGTDVDEE